MKKISGYLLVALGILHICLGVFSGWKQIKDVFSYGVWNALGQQSQSFCMNNISCLQINTIWWFISFGLMLILFGALCIWIELALKRAVPSIISWLLLVISLIYAVLIPISGFWLVMLIAIYMIVSARCGNEKNC